jgi:hypothetical protein
VSRHESRLPAGVAVLVALTAQLTLSSGLVPGPAWVLPSVEGALLLGLLAAEPGRLTAQSKDLRLASIALIAVVSLSNALALARLVDRLVNGHGGLGRDLLAQAAGVWITNVVVFALTYWELDRGGPLGRAGARTAPEHPDLWFPQDGDAAGAAPVDWEPTFVDYLFVSVTTSTAFSPTDTMPLTARATLLQASQGLLSLLTVGLVAARAVNILS